MDAYYAHSKEGEPLSEWHRLETHLTSTGLLAKEFARVFGADAWGELIGLVHDVGKASEAFQRRIRGSSEQVDHSSAGAQLLHEQYGSIGTMLAYLVAGHHGGLPNYALTGELTPLAERLAKPIEAFGAYEELINIPPVSLIRSSAPRFLLEGGTPERKTFSFAFLLEMLFSCLVDADYLDTERTVQPDKALKRVYQGLSLSDMSVRLEAFMEGVESKAQDGGLSLDVLAARMDIRRACIDAAGCKPGIFTLTVPTGGGKTLASLSFALAHALHNGQDRIIYASPFTTITSQTALAFKRIFGDQSVLEHHSNYSSANVEDGQESSIAEKLLTENWSAPLIVTTNVQLFESLYSNKTSRSRKTHNIANSIVVLDEAQSIPDAVLKPCLAAIEELSNHYGTSVVLCTATQPALSSVWPFESVPKEIVPPARQYYDLFARRASIRYVGMKTPDDIASELANHKQALCIVSSRKAAGALYDKLVELIGSDSVFHLSALMVPAHRDAVLDAIRASLERGVDCIVVSTQLIEAGVDIDFPVVYRELAGIDSILQAAGRCNREGRRSTGVVHVFDCPDFAISKAGWLARMRALGQEVIELSSEPFGNHGSEEFFQLRYSVEDTDKQRILARLTDASRIRDCSFDFEQYGADFKFVEDQTKSVFVPWGEEGINLLDRLTAQNADIGVYRAIQQYSVGVPVHAFDKLARAGRIVEHGPVSALEPVSNALVGYSEARGLILDETNYTLTI